MSERISTRVKRGARFLDKQMGRGWRRKIRRRDLNLGSPRYRGPGSCGGILAQLSAGGDYESGLRELGIKNKPGADMRYGFDTEDEDYGDLTEAWLTELRRS